MGLMSAMSEWVQVNTSILQSRTCCICSFSALDRRELTYMDLSGPSRHIDSRGSTANSSLSSTHAWVASCNCYSEACVSRARL